MFSSIRYRKLGDGNIKQNNMVSFMYINKQDAQKSYD